MAGIGFNAATAAEVPDSGASPGGAEKETYVWDVVRRKVIIQNHPSSGITMAVRFNADDAAAGVWDVFLSAGDSVVSPDGLLVSQASIYFSGAGTLGTNYSVKGWE